MSLAWSAEFALRTGLPRAARRRRLSWSIPQVANAEGDRSGSTSGTVQVGRGSGQVRLRQAGPHRPVRGVRTVRTRWGVIGTRGGPWLGPAGNGVAQGLGFVQADQSPRRERIEFLPRTPRRRPRHGSTGTYTHSRSSARSRCRCSTTTIGVLCRCKADAATLSASLQGNCRDEHPFALEQALARHDMLQGQIEACEARIDAELDQHALDAAVDEPPSARTARDKALRQAAAAPDARGRSDRDSDHRRRDGADVHRGDWRGSVALSVRPALLLVAGPVAGDTHQRKRWRGATLTSV